jgi:predicted Zn-dependent protease
MTIKRPLSCDWECRFKEAELAADKGVKLDGSLNWIKLNLAHALLFQDKYEGALAIYQSLKEATGENGKTYVALCFEDLYALERAGIVHKDVSKVRTDLKK